MRPWTPTPIAFAVVGALLALGCGTTQRSPAPLPHPLFGAEAKSFLVGPVTVEIRPSQGRVVDQHALTVLAQRINERCAGPVRFVTDNPAPLGLGSWDRSALDSFERLYRSTLGPRVLFVAWLGGRSALGPAVVGETFSPHSVAIFPDSREHEAAEALVHEFGHVLGLVRTPRMDRDHPFHDVDPRCVMFYRTVGVTDFCALCKRDLEITKGG